jgi:hypothetical protein
MMVSMLFQHRMLKGYMAYSLAVAAFVVALRPGHYHYQYRMFGWSHATLACLIFQVGYVAMALSNVCNTALRVAAACRAGATCTTCTKESFGSSCRARSLSSTIYLRTSLGQHLDGRHSVRIDRVYSIGRTP